MCEFNIRDVCLVKFESEVAEDGCKSRVEFSIG
jgi:hypothetical protein